MSKPEQITIFELQLISGCYRNICSGSISAGSHRRIAGERRNHRASFTLIELLIVIAIIAILACLLLPALNQARTRGHAAKCVSNQKQTMLAQIQYSNDYSGYMVAGSIQISGTMGKLGVTSDQGIQQYRSTSTNEERLSVEQCHPVSGQFVQPSKA